MAIIYTSELPTLFEKIAGFIVQKANEAIQKKGSFYWALSGGKTPNALFSLLAKDNYHHQINWNKTYIFWSDERYVPLDHPDNNSQSARQHLLDRVPVPAANIFVAPVNLPLEEAAAAYQSEIEKHLGINPVFDLVMLGLGTDGHTASLFPGSSGLSREDAFVIPVDEEGIEPKRISFSLPLINNAANVMFVVTGNNKSAVLRRILTADGENENLPAQMIKPAHGELYWFLDAEAMPDSVIQPPH